MKCTRYLFSSLILSLMCSFGTAQAKDLYFTVYMGNAHIYIGISERSAIAGASDVMKPVFIAAGSALDPEIYGQPSNMYTFKDSPLKALNFACERALQKLKESIPAESHSCRVFMSIAGYAEGSRETIAVDTAQLPEELRPLLTDYEGRTAAKPEIYQYVITKILSNHGIKVDVDSAGMNKDQVSPDHKGSYTGSRNVDDPCIWMNGDQLVAGRVARMALEKAGAQETKEVHFLHAATCPTGYVVAQGDEPKARKGSKPGGQFSIGEETITKHLAPLFHGKSQAELRGDQIEKNKLKQMTFEGFADEWKDANPLVQALNASTMSNGYRGNHQWMLPRWSIWLGKNEVGELVCRMSDNDGSMFCTDGSMTYHIPSDVFGRASALAEPIVEQEMTHLAGVLQDSFPASDGADCPIVIVGEFVHAFKSEHFEKLLKEKLSPELGGRLKIVGIEEFRELMPLAGASLMDEIMSRGDVQP